ncbi:MAG: antitoxin component YwqK of YwqJK toxin-antitoxin module [Glaciecola sp.]|jgi:antitoxin component YwqK of YwqJK toxin-antitoxin module
MSSQRHLINVLIICFVSMNNLIAIFMIVLLTGCQTSVNKVDSNKDDAVILSLPDTTFGFSKVQITQEIKAGVLHEYKQYYFPNGTIAMQGEFINFTKENWWEEYHVTGKLKSRGPYHHDKKQGDWSMYYENGTLQSIGPFDVDQMHGWWKHYNEVKQIISEGNYENGEKTGYWITYENEITHTEGKYDKGEPVGLWKYYEDNGELESTFDFE